MPDDADLDLEMVHKIAELLDHPTVYMGGPSQHNMRRAYKIHELYKAEIERLRELIQTRKEVRAIAMEQFKRERDDLVELRDKEIERLQSQNEALRDMIRT